MKLSKVVLAGFVVIWAGALPLASSCPLQPGGSGGPVTFRLDGDTAEWRGIPETYPLLVSQPGSRAGRIWVAQTEDGLALAGEVAGTAPHWIRDPAKAEPGDFVEIWLADTVEPTLPPVGFGHQFGYVYPRSESDCQSLPDASDVGESGLSVARECVKWMASQAEYRKTFRKLFLRGWRLTPRAVTEIAATPAFASLSKESQSKLVVLMPGEAPAVKLQDHDLEGLAYRFEAIIPWGAFPPMRPLRLGEVRLRVDIFASGAGASVVRSSTTDVLGGDTFNPFPLPTPREYFLTPCRYSPRDFVIDTGPSRTPLVPSDNAQVYFQPRKDLNVENLIVVENEVAGYQYHPNPESRSPIAYSAPFFSRDLGSGRTVCWPRLAFWDGRRLFTAGDLIDPGARVELRAVSDSRFLLKVGPTVAYSYYGSGQCGGCPRVSLDIYSLDVETGGLVNGLSYFEVVGGFAGQDLDIEVSPNWKTVTVFESRSAEEDPADPEVVWTATRYCFDGGSGKYQECGRRTPVPEPSPRRLRF